jgi:TRAP-type C4-dicarboxylate transport system permease large subunit
MMCGTAASGSWSICLLQSLLALLIIIIAIGLMLRILTPGDAFKHIAVACALVTVLVLLARTLSTLWSEMSFAARTGLIVIGVFLWRWKHRTRKGREE